MIPSPPPTSPVRLTTGPLTDLFRPSADALTDAQYARTSVPGRRSSITSRVRSASDRESLTNSLRRLTALVREQQEYQARLKRLIERIEELLQAKLQAPSRPRPAYGHVPLVRPSQWYCEPRPAFSDYLQSKPVPAPAVRLRQPSVLAATQSTDLPYDEASLEPDYLLDPYLASSVHTRFTTDSPLTPTLQRPTEACRGLCQCIRQCLQQYCPTPSPTVLGPVSDVVSDAVSDVSDPYSVRNPSNEEFQNEYEQEECDFDAEEAPSSPRAPSLAYDKEHFEHGSVYDDLLEAEYDSEEYREQYEEEG